MRYKASYGITERGLSGAAWPCNAQEFAFLDAKVYPFQGIVALYAGKIGISPIKITYSYGIHGYT
jgi:hypothetical protein